MLFETSRADSDGARTLFFQSPLETLTATEPGELPGLFERMERRRAEGRWAAGFIAYECGYHLDDVLPHPPAAAGTPLARIGIFEAPTAFGAVTDDEVPESTESPVRNLQISIGAEAYHHAVERIRRYIAEGDAYQVNFTDAVTFGTDASPEELYVHLRRRQRVPYAAFLNLGERHILSFSPELFFRTAGRTITCRPMKGTAPRGADLDGDRRNAEWLRTDEKNRSENLMIVDLLRNDLGRICVPGSVAVPAMFSVETYDSVLQMTSTVTGTLRPEVRLFDIVRALFPCGSVTGAPKIRAMQIIRELERHERGVYCGAVGFISPEGDAVFNVPIRTVELSGGNGRMGVGSGIVFDSDPVREYDECLLKASFLTRAVPDHSLIETMLWENGFPLLDLHLDRLRSSAEYFGIPMDEGTVRAALKNEALQHPPGTRRRFRLLLRRDGRYDIESSELAERTVRPVMRLAPERIRSTDPSRRHKTTDREVYDRYARTAAEEGILEYLFLNERGEAAEGSIHSLFIETGTGLLTPPLESGALPGVYRRYVLETDPRAKEAVITLDDVRNANELFLCNALRGMRRVTFSEE